MTHEHPDGGNVVPIQRSRWLTDADYDPTAFFTVSVDANGHNTILSRVAVPPETAARIRELIENPLFPEISTQPQFIRDAIYHRLHFFSEYHPDPAIRADLRALLDEVALAQEVSNAAAVAERYGKIMSGVREAGEAFLQYGDREGLQSLCDKTRAFCQRAREPYASALAAAVASIERRAFKAGLM